MSLLGASTARLFTCLAQAEAKAPGTGLAGSEGPAPDPALEMVRMFGMLGALGLIFYFLIWRPESKRRKQRAQLVNALKPKDKVVTIGGLHGVVVDVEKDEVVLLVDPKKEVKMRFRRSAIESIEASASQGEEKK